MNAAEVSKDCTIKNPGQFQCLNCEAGTIIKNKCNKCSRKGKFVNQFLIPPNLCEKEVIYLQKIVAQCHDDFLNNIVVPILENKWGISLRTVDWFVTNYSKQHHPAYWHSVDSGQKHVSVYNSYQAQLKNYRRRLFDVFRRKKRIYFLSVTGEQFATTVAQLNFFLWAHSNGILQYCEKHIKAIDRHMVTTIRKHRERKAQMTEKKRCEIAPSRPDKVFIYAYPTTFTSANEEVVSEEKGTKRRRNDDEKHEKKSVVNLPKTKKNKNMKN